MSEAAHETIAALEASADAAEAAMYAAPPRQAKDHKDDACGFLLRAFEEAKQLGPAGEAARLKARLDNLIAIWDRQFRGASY